MLRDSASTSVVCKSTDSGLVCRPLAELIPKERLGGLAVFSQALRLVPYILPDNWSGPRICEDLPGQGAQHLSCPNYLW